MLQLFVLKLLKMQTKAGDIDDRYYRENERQEEERFLLSKIVKFRRRFFPTK
jgi:hypothetical protein